MGDELKDSQLVAEVVSAPTGEQGLRILEEGGCDLILLDYRLPDTDGLGFLREIRQRGYATPVLFVTTADSVDLAVEAMKLGAEDFLQKQEGYLEILPLMVREAIDRIALREQKARLEEQLKQSERLASVGILAAGLAHNINNRLTSLKTFFELSSASPEGPPLEAGFLEICRQDLDRIVLLVQELTRYAFSETVVDPLSEPIHELIERAIGHVIDDAERKRIRIRQELQEVPRAPVESEGIKQMMINLLKNAVEASPAGSEILVDLSIRDGDQKEVVVRIEDAGPGLPEELRDRIFDPFFTTKDHGLGIGLYLCHKIATQHRGRIEVGKAKEGGALFSVFLPVAEAPPVKETEAARPG